MSKDDRPEAEAERQRRRARDEEAARERRRQTSDKSWPPKGMEQKTPHADGRK